MERQGLWITFPQLLNVTSAVHDFNAKEVATLDIG